MANAYVRKLAAARGSTTALVATNGATASVAGNLIVIALSRANRNDVSGITDSAGNTYSLAVARNEDGGNWWTSEIWYCFNANSVAGTTGTWTATGAVSADYGMTIHEYSGLGVGSVSTTGKSNQAAADPWASLSTDGSSVAGDLIIVGLGLAGGHTWTATGYNQRDSGAGSTDPSVGLLDVLSGAGGTVSVTPDPSAASAGSSTIACFTPAGGGGGGTKGPIFRRPTRTWVRRY